MSLYVLSDFERDVDIQRPKRVEVRSTEGDRTVAVAEIRDDGTLAVLVAPGVTIETLDMEATR